MLSVAYLLVIKQITTFIIIVIIKSNKSTVTIVI